MLEVKNLSKLDRVYPTNLTLAPGNIYSLIGPNGAGKSTLLHLIGGFLKSNSGRVLWKGTNLFSNRRKEVAKVVHLIPQVTSISFSFTVGEMVSMGRYALDKEGIDEVLNKLEVIHLKNRLITELSGGEVARVYLARALATEAPILLLDEPAANLDIYHELNMWKLLQSIKEEGKLIIAAHHHFNLAKRFSDETMIMNKGRVIAKGPFKELTRLPLLSEIFQVDLTSIL